MKGIECTPWEPYFAWRPVFVDAYDISEIKNGKTRYLKWGWVDRQFCTWTDPDDEDPITHRVWRYRLTRLHK